MNVRPILAGTCCMVLVSLSGLSANASCPIAQEASDGGRTGYEADTAASKRVYELDNSVSETLADCIGGITAIGAGFSFPTLDDLFEYALDQVCRVANDQVASIVSDVDGHLNNIPGVDVSDIAPGLGEIRPIDIDIQRNNGGFEARERTEKIDWTDLF